jgi:osmotically-inducible protein OsmY
VNVQEAALRREVLEELEWEPRIGSSAVDVGVAAHGVVTLTGVVKSYAEKVAAERAAKRVRGVHAVVNDIDVKLPMSHERNDADIADAVVRALEWNVLVPHDTIEARVSDGWVRLEGAVDWNYHRTAAEEAVQQLAGVKGVTNLITVKPHVIIHDVRERIEAALGRNAELEAHRIKVEAQDGKVILRGHVQSWGERAAAEAAAWAAPGVAAVEDELEVES